MHMVVLCAIVLDKVRQRRGHCELLVHQAAADQRRQQMHVTYDIRICKELFCIDKGFEKVLIFTDTMIRIMTPGTAVFITSGQDAVEPREMTSQSSP